MSLWYWWLSLMLVGHLPIFPLSLLRIWNSISMVLVVLLLQVSYQEDRKSSSLFFALPFFSVAQDLLDGAAIGSSILQYIVPYAIIKKGVVFFNRKPAAILLGVTFLAMLGVAQTIFRAFLNHRISQQLFTIDSGYNILAYVLLLFIIDGPVVGISQRGRMGISSIYRTV